MNINTFFIGIDSGGTKSELIIADEKNNLIHKAVYASVHFSSHGKTKVTNHLKNIISKTLKEKKLNIRDCGGICVGLAGVRENEDKKEIKNILANLFDYKKILIESDSVIALNGAFNGKDGLTLICGTGSILIGLIDKKFFRIGGWGRTIGDYGSGYSIGKNAIILLTKEYDEGGKLSKLSQSIEKKFSINKKNILRKVYQENFDFQNIVPLVLNYAKRKEKTALIIIDMAVEELLYHLKIFFSVSGYRKKINLSFSGSILENENILLRKLKQRIKKDFKKINLVNKLHSPSEGAIILAKNKFHKN